MKLTDDTIAKTRQYFIDINKALITDVKSGDLKVNDNERFIQWKLDNIEYFESSPLVLNNFTFLQRAHFIQTGEMIPLLKFEELQDKFDDLKEDYESLEQEYELSKDRIQDLKDYIKDQEL